MNKSEGLVIQCISRNMHTVCTLLCFSLVLDDFTSILQDWFTGIIWLFGCQWSDSEKIWLNLWDEKYEQMVYPKQNTSSFVWYHLKDLEIPVCMVTEYKQVYPESKFGWRCISIKSEVSTFPIVVIFFRGCVSEMVVLSYSVIYYIYIPGTLGPCFHY